MTNPLHTLNIMYDLEAALYFFMPNVNKESKYTCWQVHIQQVTIKVIAGDYQGMVT